MFILANSRFINVISIRVSIAGIQEARKPIKKGLDNQAPYYSSVNDKALNHF